MARTSARSTAARVAVTPSALIATLVIAAFALLIVTSAAWAFRDGRGLLDWGSFWASGDAANQGDDPYGVYNDTFSVAGVPAPNLNPPISVYPFQLAANFDATAGRDAWNIFTLVGFTVCVAALWRAYPERTVVTVVAAFALAGLWHTLELGQIYVPLLMALTAAWLLLRHGDAWQAGLALGAIAAIKPQFAIVPGLLLLAGQWRSGASGLGTGALLSGIPLVLEGPGIYRSWLDATPPLTPANTLAGNSSLLAVFGRLELDALGLLLTLVMVAAVALFVLWQRPPRLFVVGLGVVAALLAGPITWPGYTLLLLPLLFVAPWERLVPALVFLLVPYYMVIEMVAGNREASFAFGSVYAFGVVLLAVLVLPVLWRDANLRGAIPVRAGRPRSKRRVASVPRA